MANGKGFWLSDGVYSRTRTGGWVQRRMSVLVRLFDVQRVPLQWNCFNRLTFWWGESYLCESASKTPIQSIIGLIVNEETTAELTDDRSQ